MLKKMMKSFALVAIFMLFPQGGNAAELIKLGVPGAFSGDLAGYGLPARNAAELVVEEYNAKGGIHGKLIELIAQDDQCKPEYSKNAANKLIASKVDVVMGHTCSGATKAALSIYDNKKILVISPSATSPELTQSEKFPYFFRTTPSDDTQAKLAVDFAIHVLKAKKVAILHDKGDYGKGYASYAKEFIEKAGNGCQIVFFDAITPGGVDYSPVIQKIARTQADTLIFGGYYPEASKLVTQIKARKLTINFVSEDGVKTEAFLNLLDAKSAEGVYASCSRDYSNSPIAQHAIASHEKKYGTAPGQFFMQAYAATQALLNAIEKSNSTDADVLAKTLRTEFVNTPIGKISFDERGDTIGAEFVMFKVVNGKFVEVPFSQDR